MDLNFSQCVLCNVRFMTRFFQRLVAVLPSDFRREDAGRTVPQGLEKVSYLSLTYGWKNWQFGAQCLFPFYDDKYSNETVSFAPVRHVTQTNLRTKNREFGFTISWFFQRGKENHSAKSLENSDVDSGVFRF